MLKVISPEEIEDIWPLVRNGIAEALATSNGEATVEETLQGLKSGRTSLLLLDRGESYFGMVIGVYNFPQFRIARILLGFGKGIIPGREEWKLAEQWARNQGCRYFEAWVATESRARLFRHFGFEKTYQIIRSRL